MSRNLLNLLWCAALAAALVLTGCSKPADTVDEATAAGKTVADFPETTADVFHDMDRGIALTPGEIAGRNTWILWCGGNEAFWDYLARYGYGWVDFLKVVDSRQRPERFKKLGLINEPGYHQASTPDEYGLYLDQPVSKAPDGTNPTVDGKSTGVIGFRLFPNPNFDAAAKKNWDANRYYNDPAYYQNPKLIRPYRVGMTCAVCHVAFHPLNPPQDTAEPQYANLSSTIGNQYFRTRGVFGGDLKPDNFLYHILESAHPGATETSIIATDNNNNPNIINSIYNLGARLGIDNVEQMGPAAAAFSPGGEKRRVAHILVDGADSVGVAAALDRVFVNIGVFGEEWLNCHNPILGVRTQKPFSIAYAQKHSVFWNATEARTPNLAAFLVKASAPMPLREAPGGEKYLTTDQTLLDRGKTVFAENCLGCHSSKRPNDGVVRKPDDWKQWAHEEKFLTWARAEVMKPDFLDDNYLSTDARIPITIVQTNAARALQDNATRGKIWEQFSSEDYKRTPSVGDIQVYDPFAKKNCAFTMPSGGPGFYRVPTLVGIWAGAPFLHNNGLGEYNGDPSVEGRMQAFDDAIDKMFYPEHRHGTATIARTTQTSWLVIPAVYLPSALEGVVGRIARPITALPWLLPAVVLAVAILLVVYSRNRAGRFARAALRTLGVVGILAFAVLLPLNLFIAGMLCDLKVGPFPKGTPVNVLASINPAASPLGFVSAGWKTARALWKIEHEGLADDEAARVFNAEAGPALMKVCKNQDWVEDRGHYFAARLPDDDKQALKEYLKTF